MMIVDCIWVCMIDILVVIRQPIIMIRSISYQNGGNIDEGFVEMHFFLFTLLTTLLLSKKGSISRGQTKRCLSARRDDNDFTDVPDVPSNTPMRNCIMYISSRDLEAVFSEKVKKRRILSYLGFIFEVSLSSNQ